MWPTLLVACCSVFLLVGNVSANYCNDTAWWRTATLYQVYPRSFQDSDGDGVGDLRGIIQRSYYFTEIGVQAIYLNPIFESPMRDYGYDVVNHKEIDKTFGTKDDFKNLLELLHKLGIKVLLDLVPNHTSDEHEWFVKSVAREEPYTDYYVWADGTRDPATNATRPPNNWLSGYNSSAWEYNEQRQQYYLHQFSIHQPDLNLRNRLVRDEINDIIRYWLDFGIDGWRVGAVPYIFEDCQLRDEPALPGTSGNTVDTLDHIYTQNLPEAYLIAKDWANIALEYSEKDGKCRLMLVEVFADLAQTVKYFGTGDLDLLQPYNFELLKNASSKTQAIEFAEIINGYLAAIPQNASPNWVIGTHDISRVATRFGVESVDAITMLLGCLGGLDIVYYGDEIAMEDTFILGDEDGSRNPERTPMQWDDSPSAGFSTNTTTWLPVNPEYYYVNVAEELSDARSHLKVFQDVVWARQDIVLQRGSVEVIAPNNDTLLAIRKLGDEKIVLLSNMGSYVETYTSENTFTAYGIDDNYTVIVSSTSAAVKTGTSYKKGSIQMSLRPRAAIMLRTTISS